MGTPIDDIRSILGKMADQFRAVLPTQEHVDRYIRVVMTAVQQDAKLMEANRNSFYAACMKCAQDGLLPDGKEATLQVYNTNLGTKDKPDWQKIVQYQPMVEGMMKKLRISGEIVGAPKVHVVREGDEFHYELGDNERIVHRPSLGQRGRVVAAYSIVRLRSGDTSREVISISEIMEIRADSKARDSGPWFIPENGVHTSDFGEMCRKTVFRRHYKKLPKSTDLDNVISSDNEIFVPREIAINGHVARTTQGAAAETSQQEGKRPAALEHVVASTIPEPKPDKREPVTVAQEKSATEKPAPPTDII